jgi:hypothetical protein
MVLKLYCPQKALSRGFFGSRKKKGNPAAKVILAGRGKSQEEALGLDVKRAR